MNTAWKKVKLGDLLTIKHGWAFKGEYFCSEGELILLTPGNFHEEGGFKIQIGKEKFYSGAFPKDYLLKKDDLIIAMTEQGAGLLGSPAIVPQNDRFLHNQRLGLLQIDHQKAITKYIYYLFFTKEVRNSIASTATGTKVRHTAPKRIYNIDIPLPPLETQTQIANILSAYDDLIENNLRRIKLLEEMAELTYREWFVNFKIDGKTLEIDKNTGLPFGWARKKIGEYIKTASGGTPSRKKENIYFSNGTIPWIKTQELRNNLLINSDEKITEIALKESSAKLFPPKTVLLAMYGNTIGQTAFLTIPATTNQAACAFLNENKEYKSYYIHLFLMQNKEKILSYRMGAAQENISQEIIKSIEIIVPTDNTLVEFSILIEPIYQQMENLSHQNRLLKESRDILLPRLMSGEIGV